MAQTSASAGALLRHVRTGRARSRADPEVAEAVDGARVGELAVPTLGEGESLDDLRTASHDPKALGERGLHFERLDQLAMEHLLGVR